MSRGAEGHAGTEGVVEPITGATEFQIICMAEAMHEMWSKLNGHVIEEVTDREADEWESIAIAGLDSLTVGNRRYVIAPAQDVITADQRAAIVKAAELVDSVIGLEVVAEDSDYCLHETMDCGQRVIRFQRAVAAISDADAISIGDVALRALATGGHDGQ